LVINQLEEGVRNFRLLKWPFFWGGDFGAKKKDYLGLKIGGGQKGGV